MQKFLSITTSAVIAGFIFTSVAAAATDKAANKEKASVQSPVKLTVNGFMNSWIGYTNLSKKKYGDGINQFAVGTDGKVRFNVLANINNDFKIGGLAELAIARLQQNGYLGDYYIFVDSKFGRFVVGGLDNASVKTHHSAPDVGVLGIEKSKLINWLGLHPIVAMDSTSINWDGGARKVSYYTPKFYGFQLTGTYTPGAKYENPFGIADGPVNPGVASADTVISTGRHFNNTFFTSVAYNNVFGDVKVGGDFAYGHANNVGKRNVNQYSIGASLGYNGFTLGSGFAIRSYDKSDMHEKNSYAFDIGLAYENDSFGVSASYFYSTIGKNDNPATSKSKLNMYQVSGRYKLGSGVDTFATFGYVDMNKTAAAYHPDANRVWTILTGLALNF